LGRIRPKDRDDTSDRADQERRCLAESLSDREATRAP